MKKFQFLVFIDDDHPTNVYHEIIIEESGLCESSKFFLSPMDALAFFKELSQQENPLLPEYIFLDINMPGLNGWEFIEQFKMLQFSQPPAIIMLTTSTYHKDIDHGENSDLVFRFFNKPLDIAQLEMVSKETAGGLLLHEE